MGDPPPCWLCWTRTCPDSQSKVAALEGTSRAMDMAEIRLTVSAPMVCRAGSTVATMTSERATDSGAN